MNLTIFSPSGHNFGVSGTWHAEPGPPRVENDPPVVGYVTVDRRLRVGNAVLGVGERLTLAGAPTVIESESGRILWTAIARGAPLPVLRGAWVCAWKREGGA